MSFSWDDVLVYILYYYFFSPFICLFLCASSRCQIKIFWLIENVVLKKRERDQILIFSRRPISPATILTGSCSFGMLASIFSSWFFSSSSSKVRPYKISSSNYLFYKTSIKVAVQLKFINKKTVTLVVKMKNKFKKTAIT